MRKLFLAITLFFYWSAQAQDGYLSLKHYKVPLPEQDHVFNDLTVDVHNRVLLAHRKGILQFDGRIWDKVKTESTPYKFLTIDSSSYVLTRNGIGLLKEDIYYQNVLENIYRNENGYTGKDLLKYNGAFYYLINKSIKKLSIADFSEDTTYKSNLGYEDIFVLQNRLFAFEGNFLLELIDGTWVDLNKYAAENSEFVFSCQTKNQVFFAYDNGDFFSFNGDELKKYSNELNQYLEENYPVSGKVIKDKLLIATISGGAVVVDIASSEIDYTIQYYNGLPADEVKAITLDKQGGIWLAHEAGLSRAIPDLPLKEFQHYPGLEGLPEVVYKRNDTLVVGTNEGLFYLAEVRDYETLQKVFKQRVKVKSPETTKEEESTEGFFDNLFDFGGEDSEKEEYIDAQMQKYKSIYRKQGYRFKSLREKLDAKENALRDSIASVSDVKKGKSKGASYTYRTVNKVVNVSKLKSVKYQFKRYSGIDKKVVAVKATSKGLVVLASEGLYLIKGTEAVKLVNKLFLDNFMYDEPRELLWLYGVDGLYTFDLGEDNPKLRQKLNFEVRDLSIQGDEVAIANSSKIASYNYSADGNLSLINESALDNAYAAEVLIYHQKGQLHVLNADGMFTYNSDQDSLILNKSLTSKNSLYLKDDRNQVWLSSDQNWQILNNDNLGKELTWLKIVPNMNGLHYISDDMIYFVSQGKIIRLNNQQEYDYTENESFIRGAYQSSSELLDDEEIELTHDNNTLKISLSTPEYLYPEGVKYQYYIKGLMDDWSAWSGASEIEFPFIPTGDYTLKIKSKTGIYANVNEFDFKFEVLPPYWQTWWFYMLEIGFFSSLILLSQRLNRSSKNTYLTNVITFLTLILFIEFLATVLENNLEGYLDESPVYGFLLNVVLALSITPLERGMNKMLVVMNSKKVKNIVSKMRDEDQNNN